MRTARRRETLIALLARRTAHRVATDAFLHTRSRLKSALCVRCGGEFATEIDDTICSGCRELLENPLPGRPVTRVGPVELIGEIYDDSYRDRARMFVFVLVGLVLIVAVAMCWREGLLEGL